MPYNRNTLKDLLFEWAVHGVHGGEYRLSSATLEEIYRALPNDRGFASTNELRSFLTIWWSRSSDDYYDDCADSGNEERQSSIDREIEESVNSVINDLEKGKEYRYECGLGLCTGRLSSAEMWSRHIQLDHSTRLRCEDRFVKLVGVVSAPWSPNAVRKIEQMVRTVLGASIALHLASLRDAPTHLHDVTGLPLLRLSSSDVAEVALYRDLAYTIVSTRFAGRENETELEQARTKRLEPVELREHWFRPLVKLWANQTERGNELKHACEVLCRAYGSWEPAEMVFLSVMCLEGLLLPSNEKEGNTNRLKEAVAFLLGRTSEERKTYRELVGKLYDVRSKYVHQGLRSSYDEFKNSHQRGRMLEPEESLEKKALELAELALQREILSSCDT